MLELIKKELFDKHVSGEQMISVNFEDMNYSNLATATALHDYLKQKIDSLDVAHIFFLMRYKR